MYDFVEYHTRFLIFKIYSLGLDATNKSLIESILQYIT